jgi:hypothetical protein
MGATRYARAMWDPTRRHDRREALFGGTRSVRVWSLLDRAPIPPFGAVLACELEAGGRVGDHVQEQLDEIVIVLEGRGAISVDGAKQAVAPGVVAQLPVGSILAIENLSETEPLRYLIVKATR